MTDPLVLRNLRILYNVALDVKTNGYLLDLYQVPRAYDRSDRLVPDPYFLENEDCVFCLHPTAKIPTSDDELRKMIVADDITINDVLTYQWIFYRRDDEPSDARHPTTGKAAVTREIGHNSGYTLYLAEDAYSPINPTRPSRKGNSLFSEFILLTLPLQSIPTRFSSVSKPAPPEKTGKRPSPTAFPPGINTDSNAFRPFSNVPFPSPGIQPNPQ
jgi:hypothetical protein